MKIKWGVDEEGCREHILTIPDDEFEGRDETTVIEEWVEHEFRNNLSYWWENI